MYTKYLCIFKRILSSYNIVQASAQFGSSVQSVSMSEYLLSYGSPFIIGAFKIDPLIQVLRKKKSATDTKYRYVMQVFFMSNRNASNMKDVKG